MSLTTLPERLQKLMYETNQMVKRENLFDLLFACLE
jgi:hypothetical protein